MQTEKGGEELKVPLVLAKHSDTEDPLGAQHCELDLPALISKFSGLLDVMDMLWWPELSLSPLFFGFGFWAWQVIPYAIQVGCYGTITYCKYIAICKLKDIIDSLLAFEKQFAAICEIRYRSGAFVDRLEFEDVNGNVAASGGQGGGPGDPFQIDVAGGERLTRLTGQENTQFLITVQFTTNHGRKTDMMGHPDERWADCPEFTFQAAAGNHIVRILRDESDKEVCGIDCGRIIGIVEQSIGEPRLAMVEKDFFLTSDKFTMLQYVVPLPWPKWVTVGFSTVPTYMEMLAACMAAGASYQSWSDAAQDSWVASWSLLLGHNLASRTNLPAALTGMAAFRICTHTNGYMRNAKRARAVLKKTLEHGKLEDVEDLIPLFLAITAAADSANLLLVSAVTSHCARLLNFAMGNDRTVRFFQKVLLGVVPALWLKISLLQHSFEELQVAGRRAVIVAVLLALLAAVGPTKEQFNFIMNHNKRVAHAKRMDGAADVGALKMRQFWNLLNFAFACLLIIASFIRFAGVWYCSNHIFQLSEMQCMTVIEI